MAVPRLRKTLLVLLATLLLVVMAGAPALAAANSVAAPSATYPELAATSLSEVLKVKPGEGLSQPQAGAFARNAPAGEGRPPRIDLLINDKSQAVDQSPNRIPATVTGTALTTSPFGPALQFSQTPDRILVASNRLLGSLSRFLLEAWYRPDDHMATQTLVKTEQFELKVNGGRLEGSVAKSGGGVQSVASAMILSRATWYHVALAADGGQVALYVNGQRQASAAYTPATPATALSLTAGQGSGQLQGALARIRLSDSAPTADGKLLDLTFPSMSGGQIQDLSAWGQPIVNRGVSLDGNAYFSASQGDYLLLPAVLTTGALQNFAAQVSFQTSTTSGRQNLMEGSNFSLFLDGETLVASVLDSSGVWRDSTRAYAKAAARYTALLSYDGQRVDLYLNGELAASAQILIGLMPVEQQPVFIGTHPGLRWYFNGNMSDVKLWNSAKSGGDPLIQLTFDPGSGESYQSRDVSIITGPLPDSSAAHFGSNAAYIEVPMRGALGATYSIDTWFRYTEVTATQMIAFGTTWALFIDGATLKYGATDGGRGSGNLESPSTVSLNTWHHVAVTRENGMTKLWLDGVVVDQDQLPVPARSEAAIQLGLYNKDSFPLHGDISRFAINPGLINVIINWSALRNMRIEHVELTQAIQTVGNTVPLVYGKKTVARVFVRSALLTVPNVEVKVWAFQGGTPLAGSPLTYSLNWDANAVAWAPYTVTSAAYNRSNTFSSLNISLPAAWYRPPSKSQDVLLFFQVNPDGNPSESKTSDNWAVNWMHMTDVPKTYVKAVPLNITKGGSTYSTTFANAVSLVPFMRQVYPVRSDGGVTLFSGPTLNITANPATDAGWSTVWSKVVAARTFDAWYPYMYWYGLIPEAAGGAYYGMGQMPGYVSIGMAGPVGPNYYGRQTTFAHEIGHNHGRPHASFDHGEGASGEAWPYPHGGTGDVGFDTTRMQALAPGSAGGTHFHDFMAYGYPRWVSIKGWNALMAARLARPNPHDAAGAADVVPLEFADYLVLSGGITAQGAWSLDSAYQGSILPPTNEGADRATVAKLLDASGRTIAEAPVTLVHPHMDELEADGDGHTHDAGILQGWSVAIPVGANTAFSRFIIVQGGTPVLTVNASANRPVIDGLTISQLTSAPNRFRATWRASDRDGNPLTYQLLYAPDGVQWTPVAIGLTGTQFDFSTEMLPGGNGGKFRLLASDGLLGASLDSGAVTVPKKGPISAMDAPTSLMAGRSFSAVATALDPEDGALGDGSVRWLINGQSAGQGEELSLPGLPTGNYTLTLIATDSDGNESRTTQALAVTAPVINPTPISTLIEMWINNPNAKLNQVDIVLDQPPTIINSRTLVPVRFIAEGFGAEVGWNPETRTVTLVDGNTVIQLTIDSTIAYVNGERRVLDVAPTIINSRTMLPVRFISENFGATVGWDDATRKVTVSR